MKSAGLQGSKLGFICFHVSAQQAEPMKYGFSLGEKDFVFPEFTLTHGWSEGSKQARVQEGGSHENILGTGKGQLGISQVPQWRALKRCVLFTP